MVSFFLQWYILNKRKCLKSNIEMVLFKIKENSLKS